MNFKIWDIKKKIIILSIQELLYFIYILLFSNLF